VTLVRVDILSLDPGAYEALAAWLDARADEIDEIARPISTRVESVIFSGTFASRAKAELRREQRRAAEGADAVRRAAAVTRARAADLVHAQREERQRLAVVEEQRRVAAARRESGV